MVKLILEFTTIDSVVKIELKKEASGEPTPAEMSFSGIFENIIADNLEGMREFQEMKQSQEGNPRKTVGTITDEDGAYMVKFLHGLVGILEGTEESMKDWASFNDTRKDETINMFYACGGVLTKDEVKP